MKRRTLLLLPFICSAANAHSKKLGGIKIGHAWAKPAASGLDSQCFMPLLNTTANEDALIAAHSDLCASVELHRNYNYAEPAETQFALLQNQPVAMRPEATHLRLVALRKDLRLGDRFNLTIVFATAGEIELEIYVENAPGK
jgi:periplasmic copper chaperone A